jgi:hypothetical protein|tara:strand:+ start:7916 stop:8146 length:231 start_codon:yes stop_codon:yes gene_type:complete
MLGTGLSNIDPTNERVKISMWENTKQKTVHDEAKPSDQRWLGPEVEVSGRLDIAWWVMWQMHEASGRKHTFEVQEG